jgi:flagellin-like hook-associated protein FlgL
MSKTQVILGAKKVQLTSNIERLSAVLIQTQIARGGIFDADAAREASRLAKQQILAGAASQMISLASVQKRGLIDMLI